MVKWCLRALACPVLSIGFILALGFDPDVAFVHQVNLFLNDLFMILGMFHWCAMQIKVFGIDWLLVQHLVEFSTQILHPIVPLCSCPVVTQGFDINHAGHICRAGAVVLSSNNLSFIVDDVGAAPNVSIGVDSSGKR